MSTVSASSYDLSSALKRKRGRPRKDEIPGSEPNRRRVLRSPRSNVSLVGREVSGSFVGVFDAGYLLTVQVGDSGPIMKGLVFDPHLSVPISAENDIAPHLPMLQRIDSSPPIEDFLNRGAVSPQADLAQKNPMQMAPSDRSHVLPSATETVGPTKTLKIFLEGAAAETSNHLDSQFMVEDTPISVGLSNVSKPSNASNPSVVSWTSLEASRDEPTDTSKISDVPWNIPKESLSGLPFNISPAVFKPLEASAQRTNPDEQKSPAASRHETLETRNMGGENLPSVEPSEDRKANDFLSEIPVGAKSHTAAAEKLEDNPTVPEASAVQP